MKRAGIIFVLGVTAWLLVSCETTTNWEVDVPGKGRIYTRMEAETVQRIMGEPESVGKGTFGCNYSRHFRDFVPGPRTVEWSWKLPDKILVVYLKEDLVDRVGYVVP